MIDVALIGGSDAECGLIARFLADCVPQVNARQASADAVFDGRCDGIVIDASAQHQSATANYPGRNAFDRPSFHSAQWPAGFDPKGKRIAVIGDRAAHVVPNLAGADVALFDCPPNCAPHTKRRWLRRRKRPVLVAAPVERITASGIRTVDGTEHPVDVIIYATGGSTAAYFGIAMHGSPNYFMLLGPDSPVGEKTAVIEAQLSYIAECLKLMRHKGATRIEVRRSAQQQYVERARVTPPSKSFEFTGSGVRQEIYDGPATLTVGDDTHAVRVRLIGHLDPIDGRYHWQGTVFATTAELPSQAVQLTVDRQTTPARITERTPWGSYSVAGVGAPPFAPS